MEMVSGRFSLDLQVYLQATLCGGVSGFDALWLFTPANAGFHFPPTTNHFGIGM